MMQFIDWHSFSGIWGFHIVMDLKTWRFITPLIEWDSYSFALGIEIGPISFSISYWKE